MQTSEPKNPSSCESGCPNCSCGALVPQENAPSGWGLIGPALLAFWGPLVAAIGAAVVYPAHASLAALTGLLAGMAMAGVVVHIFWKG